MTDPKQKAAEESFSREYAKMPAKEKSPFSYNESFGHGWDACLKHLTEAGSEFSTEEAYNLSCQMFSPMLRDMISRGKAAEYGVELLRYQHQLSQAREAALKAEILELKAMSDQKKRPLIARISELEVEIQRLYLIIEETPKEGKE